MPIRERKFAYSLWARWCLTGFMGTQKALSQNLYLYLLAFPWSTKNGNYTSVLSICEHSTEHIRLNCKPKSSEQWDRDISLLETAKDVYVNKCLFWKNSVQEFAKDAEARTKGQSQSTPQRTSLHKGSSQNTPFQERNRIKSISNNDEWLRKKKILSKKI